MPPTALLITFDKNRQNVEFKGYSNVFINTASLIIAPKHKEFKKFKARFKFNFVKEMNLLFIFSDSLNCCLVFKGGKMCKKLHDFISEWKGDTGVQEEVHFDNSFIYFILQKVAERYDQDYLHMLSKWISILYAKEYKYFCLYEEFKMFDMLHKAADSVIRTIEGLQIAERKLREEKFAKNEENVTTDSRVSDLSSLVEGMNITFDTIPESSNENANRSNEYNSHVLKPYFEIRQLCSGKQMNQELFIFDQNDRSKCFRYSYDSRSKTFVCRQCQKMGKTIKAKLIYYGGDSFIRLLDGKHVCKMDSYVTLQPSEFTIEKPKKGNLIVSIFDEEKQETCVYICRNGTYYCKGCDTVKRSENKNHESVSGTLFKDEETGAYSFQMKSNQFHIGDHKSHQPENIQFHQDTEPIPKRRKVNADE